MKKSFSLVLSALMCLCCCMCICTATVNVVGASAENRYASAVPYGGMIEGRVTDTVYYARKEDNDMYVNPLRLPLYYATDIENACCITAGGAVIGHYDRKYEELIPNHTAIQFMGQTAYAGYDSEVKSMHQQLYQLMGSTSEGTTVAGYKKGMTSYVQNKGRSIEISGVYSKSSLNKPSYMAALEAGKLLTVFLNGFSIVDDSGIDTYNGYDTILNNKVIGYHCVAAYGYRNIRYYDSADNLIQEDNYILVHTGFTTAGLSMVRLNKYTSVQDGYIINVT